MSALLIKHPLLLLFVVASLGYLIGSIKVKGGSLGAAAVLFVGLAFGAISPDFIIPDIVFQLGLILFVYSIGLSSGPAFFRSYKKNGWRDFLFILSMLILSAAIAFGLFHILGLTAGATTGIYAGSTTNTPALASVIDFVAKKGGEEGSLITNDLVLGYSFSYPMGVLGGILVIIIMTKILKIDFKKEVQQLKSKYPIGDNLTSIPVIVKNEEITGIPLRELWKENNWSIVFGRMMKSDKTVLPGWDTTLEIGDEIMLVGNQEDLGKSVDLIGEKNTHSRLKDRSEFDVKRIFISNPYMSGKTISSLNLNEKYSAIITRIRRGDTDMLARGNTVLELGDRIRFVAARKDLKALAEYFGDSYQAASKVNLFSFGLGIGIALLVGTLEFAFTDTFKFSLGYAGGPLIVGLVLGTLRRTGPIVWTLPYSATVTLQQMGLTLLLAAVGVKAGHSFIDSISMQSLLFFGCATVISMLTAFFTLLIGYKFVKIPFSILLGMVANQPAILEFALDKSKNKLPEIGYTMMFPIALIGKVIIAQVLYVLLT